MLALLSLLFAVAIDAQERQPAPCKVWSRIPDNGVTCQRRGCVYDRDEKVCMEKEEESEEKESEEERESEEDSEEESGDMIENILKELGIDLDEMEGCGLWGRIPDEGETCKTMGCMWDGEKCFGEGGKTDFCTPLGQLPDDGMACRLVPFCHYNENRKSCSMDEEQKDDEKPWEDIMECRIYGRVPDDGFTCEFMGCQYVGGQCRGVSKGVDYCKPLTEMNDEGEICNKIPMCEWKDNACLINENDYDIVDCKNWSDIWDEGLTCRTMGCDYDEDTKKCSGEDRKVNMCFGLTILDDESICNRVPNCKWQDEECMFTGDDVEDFFDPMKCENFIDEPVCDMMGCDFKDDKCSGEFQEMDFCAPLTQFNDEGAFCKFVPFCKWEGDKCFLSDDDSEEESEEEEESICNIMTLSKMVCDAFPGCMWHKDDEKCVEEGEQICCKALTAQCMACAQNMDVEDFCMTDVAQKDFINGCEEYYKGAVTYALYAQIMGNEKDSDVCKARGSKMKKGKCKVPTQKKVKCKKIKDALFCPRTGCTLNKEKCSGSPAFKEE